MGNNSTEHINEAMNKDVAESKTVPSASEAQKMLALQNNMLYIGADAYVGNPYALLGTVLEIRKTKEDCPTIANTDNASIEFSPFKIPGVLIDESSKIKEPIKRQSILVDQKLSVEVGFLNYLSGEFEGESSFSLMVFDQAAGLVNRDDDSWTKGVQSWMADNKTNVLDDPAVCYVYAVIGFVQKYIIRRKYTKFTAGAKGGAFGVNLNGQLYTSSEDYSLDIRYGLQTVILKRPAATKSLFADNDLLMEAQPAELNLLNAIAQERTVIVR
ncbi:hypothetical protein [Chitinophaga rhizophila]|uniref:Uncharacterized protein n=1 Tax=Chitinophaga rhizophila TaxID=2866212 RepID=A0ABS7GB94_9BACT|nr:hypothetical protein [Chitinophaga rhizophila]MBW8684942.1 hypothetical protein [Chitinophaga rhizophila]